MKFSQKLLKFTEPLTYQRGWRRAQRSIFRVPLRPMLAKIDHERAREIQQRYANSTAGYAKYANIEPWLRLNRERVQDLNLHRSEPKSVLDLEASSVIKRMKDKAFARQVPRDHLRRGAELMGLPLDQHITNVIAFMREKADDLGLRGGL